MFNHSEGRATCSV